MNVSKKVQIFDDISKLFVYNSLLEKLNHTETDLVMSMINFRKIKKDKKHIPEALLNKIKYLKFN